MSTPSPIDVVFSFDVTGSMAACLGQVRRVVTEVVQRLFAQVPNLHVGIISHGDYCDGADFLSLLDLTDDQQQICNFVRTAPSKHGGDAPEAYETVLARARGMKWRSGRDKVLVVIGDDVPHEPSYYLNVQHLDWRNELGLLKEAGVHVYAVQALARSHATSFYREMAQLSDGVHLDLHQFSAICDLIVAVCYKQVGQEQVSTFEQEVINAGRFTDSIGAMFDVLLSRPVREIHKTRSSLPFSPDPTCHPPARSLSKADLVPVHPSRFQVMLVDRDTDIKGFVQENGLTFKLGRGFYEFTKAVKVQRQKEIVLQDVASGAMWTGHAARAMLCLPDDSTVTLKGSGIPGYTIFVQSTSVNRKLLGGTKFLYEVSDIPC
jgi:hypothetical protein